MTMNRWMNRMMIQSLFLDIMGSQSMGFLLMKWLGQEMRIVYRKAEGGLYRKKATWSDHVQGLVGYEHRRQHHIAKAPSLYVAKWHR
jgi:hypothetical protein